MININEEVINLNEEKGKTVKIAFNDCAGGKSTIKISKDSIDETFVEEVSRLEYRTTSVSSVVNTLEKQIIELNQKLEKEQKRTRRKEWINRGRNRKGKYY